MDGENRAKFKNNPNPKDYPQRLNVSAGVGRDLPPSIRSDMPVDSDPHRAPLQVPQAHCETTTAADARRPVTGNTTTAPTPLHTGAPSPFVMDQVGKLQPTGQPADQPSPTAVDELDKLLDEIRQPPAGLQYDHLFRARPDAADVEQQQVQDRLAATQSENAQLRAHIQHAQDEADFEKLVVGVQRSLPDHLPSDFARTQLLALSVERPELAAAFDARHADRRAVDMELRRVETVLAQLARNPVADPQQIAQLNAYGQRLGLALNSREIIRRATLEVVKRGRAHHAIDETATADHDAVAAAVRGAAGKMQPEPPPNLGAMSDKELARYTKQNFGF